MLAQRAIEAADIVVLVVDASQGATDQDAAIAGEADKAGRGIIIAANKWDLMKDRGPDFVKVFDAGAAAAAEVSRLRAGPARVGDDRGAHAAAARGDRSVSESRRDG